MPRLIHFGLGIAVGASVGYIIFSPKQKTYRPSDYLLDGVDETYWTTAPDIGRLVKVDLQADATQFVDGLNKAESYLAGKGVI